MTELVSSTVNVQGVLVILRGEGEWKYVHMRDKRFASFYFLVPALQKSDLIDSRSTWAFRF